MNVPVTHVPMVLLVWMASTGSHVPVLEVTQTRYVMQVDAISLSDT